jgi:hypothetical protein
VSTEIKVITELGESDYSDEESLVEFCKSFDLWDLTVDETRRRSFIVPIMSKNERCRFVDLLIMNRREGGVVDRWADT